jgi:TonB family protein
MGTGARFWRNFGLIAGAHAALVVAFVRWGGASKTSTAQQVVWLSGAQPREAGSAGAIHPAAASAAPEQNETPEPEEQTSVAPVKSDIDLPTPTPVPTSTPRPTAKPIPSSPPKTAESAKPLVRPIPKKPVVAKSTPKPKAKPTATPVDDVGEDNAETARKEIEKLASGGSGGGGGSGRSSGNRAPELQWYGRMLHDRFHNAWEQPTTVLASGAKMSALVRMRIEKDGRVSRFEIVKSSGNVVVDESVRAVASRVTSVDPLPSGVGNGEHYDVTVNFELNPEE